MAQEMVVNLKKNSRGSNVIFQLDMSKAFDRSTGPISLRY